MFTRGGRGTPLPRRRCSSPAPAPSKSAFRGWRSPSTSTSPSGASRTRPQLAGTSAPTVTQPTRIGARPRVAPLDVEGYSADLARCREEFPDLRILSGIEAGEPHLFPASVAAVLAAGNFERVLGSLHGIVYDGTLTGIDRRTVRQPRCARGDAPLLRRSRCAGGRLVSVQCPGALRLSTPLLADGTGGRLRRSRLRGGIPGGVSRLGVVGAGVGDQHA